MRVLFVQHDHVSPLGPVGERFAHHGFEVDTHLVVAETDFTAPNIATVFPDATDYDVLVPLGAPWGAWDDDCIGNWLLPEIDWLRDAVDRGMPVLGICFGGQLVARAMGGSVAPAPRAEIGWTSIWSDQPSLVGAGPWFQFHYDRWVVAPAPRAEIGWTSIWSDQPSLVGAGPWFQFHYDRWVVPPGAVEVARTPAASQAFTIERTLAVQFHPELDAEGLQGWLDWGGASQVVEAGMDPQIMIGETVATAASARDRTYALVDAFLTDVAQLIPRD